MARIVTPLFFRDTLLLSAAVFAMACQAPLSYAEGPSPGKQTAASITVPMNQNDFRVGQKIVLTERPLDETRQEKLDYLIYLPRNYEADGRPCPLLLFLHGAGERGDRLEMVKKHGPPKLCETQADWPFVTVSPQCPREKWWSAAQLELLIDAVIAEHNIDPQRIYVTGLSMGGFGTWSLAATHASRFAAAVPICGGGDPSRAGQMVDLPIWAFHGGADPVVPVARSRAMVEAIRLAGGEAVKLTVYPGVSHDSWTATYDDPEVYQWLLTHQRKPATEK